ncbi:hypothetical protein [Chelatococcus reniformis]|uniref:hypothetical protein n=1 Tax=Chelatococcus reniformis TaxID=1494448 RepID=UPI0016654150|nr:hypothetical protein [Chelatococcus reniformis]
MAQHILTVLKADDVATRHIWLRSLPPEALLRADTAEPMIADAVTAVEAAPAAA